LKKSFTEQEAIGELTKKVKAAKARIDDIVKADKVDMVRVGELVQCFSRETSGVGIWETMKNPDAIQAYCIIARRVATNDGFLGVSEDKGDLTFALGFMLGIMLSELGLAAVIAREP